MDQPVQSSASGAALRRHQRVGIRKGVRAGGRRILLASQVCVRGQCSCLVPFWL